MANDQYHHRVVEIKNEGGGGFGVRNTTFRERRDRKLCFEIFYDLAEEWLREYLTTDESAQFLQLLSALHLDQRFMGLRQPQAVQISFGSRPFSPISRTRMASEDGGTLLFTLSPDGYVGIFFYPYKSDFRRFTEDMIYFRQHVDPQVLTSKRFFKLTMCRFVEYCELSCLDGKPSYLGRLRANWLRFAYPTSRGGRLRPSELKRFSREAAKWTLVVGLSGSIVTLVQALVAP